MTTRPFRAYLGVCRRQNEIAGGFVITIRGAAGSAVRAAFEDVELFDRGGQYLVAGPHLECRSGCGLLPPGWRLVVKARREPVKELLVLAGPGGLTPHRLAEILRFSPCPNS